MDGKRCCFLGHRTIDRTYELEEKLSLIIEELIAVNNVKYFIFGSRSEFDALCHSIVTQLRKKYPFIIRIVYNTRNKNPILEKDRVEEEKRFQI